MLRWRHENPVKFLVMSSIALNKESFTFQENQYINFSIIRCYKCCIPFAVPSNYKEHLRESQESFYCPNGHSQAYCESSADILKKKLEKEKENNVIAQRAIENLQTLYRNKSIENKRTRTMLKNTKKRITNGVCPCCNRTFENLAEHFKTKHPEQILKP